MNLKFINKWFRNMSVLSSLCFLSACVPHTTLDSFSKSTPTARSAGFSFFKSFGARKPTRKQYKSPDTYVVRGRQYTTLKSAAGYRARGLASWYTSKQRTSSGEHYDMHALTAAHRTLPLHTRLQVKNLKNGRTVVVRINDRGPFHSKRVIDLSYAAAKQLGLFSAGTVMVEIQTVTPGFLQRLTSVTPKRVTKAVVKTTPKTQAKPRITTKPAAKPRPKAKATPKHVTQSVAKAKPKIVSKTKHKPIVKQPMKRKPVVKAKPKIQPKPGVKIKVPVKQKTKQKTLVKKHQ